MAITANTKVENQEIINRFKEYLTNTANSGIIYHTGNTPFVEFPTIQFGGTNTGIPAELEIADIGGDSADIIATKIFYSLLEETNRYTAIRKLRARLFVSGDGGNTGTRPTPGYVRDVTAVAHLQDEYKTSIPTVSNAGVTATGENPTIDASNLELLLQNLKDAYTNARADTKEITIIVCHASCHSSCHSSRNRR